MIYLMRHGETAVGKKFIGQTDIPLTPKGQAQMAPWKPFFEDIGMEAVYCSELKRSIDSAEILRKTRDPGMKISSELKEIHLGRWEGEEMAVVKSRRPEQWEARGRDMDVFKPPGGESFLDVSHRVIPFFEGLARKFQDKHILIMGHAGVNRVILSHILGMPIRNLFRLEQAYACLNIIETRGTHFRLKGMNICPAPGRMSSGIESA
jgi:alpha-ribazole phosphatase